MPGGLLAMSGGLSLRVFFLSLGNEAARPVIVEPDARRLVIAAEGDWRMVQSMRIDGEFLASLKRKTHPDSWSDLRRGE
jgi:hypothetical protein